MENEEIMKSVSVLILFVVLLSCKPDQEVTDFSVTISPKPGESVESTTPEDSPVLISYSVEEDSESIDLTFEMIEKPAHGDLKDCKYLSKTKWQCIYIPHKDFFGEDQIAFKTKDGDFASKEKSFIRIKITSIPDAPIAGAGQEFTLLENSQYTFNINPGSDPDTSEDKLKYITISGPENGTLINCFEESKPTECTYIPKPDYFGHDKVSYKVIDGESSSKTSDQNTAHINFIILKEWIPVNGVSIIKVEDKPSNALIVFALDTSGSMTPYIEHMKKSVLNFIDDITKRGFKATLAFISSDQIENVNWKDIYSITKPHPNYQNYSSSYLKEWKRLPTEMSVKIFEVNAYDFNWNQETKTQIEKTKNDITVFLDTLPPGSDDERLLCSSLRFLHSDYAKDKNYVGFFSLANEEDAGDAGSLEQAFNDCRKEYIEEQIPMASCLATVQCNEGEIGCNPKWEYKYTKILKNPTPAVFKGQCEKTVNNMINKDLDWRVGQIRTIKYKTVYTQTCVDENKVFQDRRKGTKEEPNYKTVTTSVYNPLLFKDEDRRVGKKQIPVYLDESVEQCKQEWETLDNPQGCKMVNVPKIVRYDIKDVDEKGTCTPMPGGWTSCADYKKVLHDGYETKTSYVLDGTKTVTKDEFGKCEEIPNEEKNSWITCTDYQKEINNGCTTQKSTIQDGYNYTNKSEEGLCSAVSWFSCEDQTKTVLVQDGTKKEYSACEKVGGNSCAEHSSYFYGNSCFLATPAGYAADTIIPNQIKTSLTKESCLVVTGYETCESITWKGTKNITKTEGCALKPRTTSTKLFTIDGAPVQTLANSLAHKLKNSYRKSVYIAVTHDFELNTVAINKAQSNNLILPSAACENYFSRREKFGTRVDGEQFKAVAQLLEGQGSSHSICSPDRYPSDKLDYLVGDAQLDFEVPEYKLYDNLEITEVKITYASGNSISLTPLQFNYSSGHVTLIDPTLVKNLTELHITYKGFEK